MEKNDLAKKLAKIVYFCLVRPFRWLRSKIVARVMTKRLKSAKKEAIFQTNATGQPRYVVLFGSRFYVLNKGGMLALAKKYRKRTGLSAEWRDLYVFESHVLTEAEKAEAKRKKEEAKKNNGMR